MSWLPQINFVWSITAGEVLWLFGAFFSALAFLRGKQRGAIIAAIALDRCVEELKIIQHKLEMLSRLETRVSVLEAIFNRGPGKK